MITLLQRILEFSGKERNNLLKAFAFGLIHSTMKFLPIMAILVVLVALLGVLDGNEMSQKSIFISIILLLINIFGTSFFGTITSTKQTLACFYMCRDKRLAVGEMLKNAPMGYFNENKIGDIVTTLSTILDEIESTINLIFGNVFLGFVSTFILNIWLYFYVWQIGLLTSLGILISFFVYACMQAKGRLLFPQRQKAQSELVSTFLEYVQGISVIKSFGLIASTSQKIQDAIYKSANTNIKIEFTLSRLIALYQSIFKITVTILIVFSVYMFMSNDINAQKCLLLLIASFIIYAPIEMAGSMSALMRTLHESLDRVAQMMDIPKQVSSQHKEIHLKNHTISLKNVSFNYEGTNQKIDDYSSQETHVLHNINLSIPEKTSCAIVGKSGSGKTTLCSLIARFWDVDTGEILLGDTNIKVFNPEEFIENFAIVFQNVYLFHDTIFNNIAFGKENVTKEEVIQVAKRANCHDFIKQLPFGYETIVGEGGSTLSGGEKQRISIARALLKDAPIVILDEASSALDPENEALLQKAIEELTKGKTLIMIAHRLSTVKNADQIIVLDKGSIVQQGKHDTLMEKEGIYKDFIKVRELAMKWSIEKREEIQ